MIKVKNKKTISNLSKKSLKANKTRNFIAILAIALTTILFTALFTIAITVMHSFEQQTFRQVGGDMHGTFKDVTLEQAQELVKDPLVVSYGLRWMLGMPEDIPFNKSHVEVSYMDPICAKGYFCTPQKGKLPEENTDQIACDTRILKLLNVEPKIGAKLTMSYYIGANTNKQLITDTFTLSGWWTYDEASMASMAIVPKSYAEKILENFVPEKSDVTGRWDLNIYLKSSAHIEKDLKTILANHGYQNDDSGEKDYISTGVNWAYMGAQLSSCLDGETIFSMAALLILVIFTGYLIIYNIFQISVTNDIRFYGLLKTIGTTAKQIRSMILRQALYLSVVGIPIGLLIGYLTGNILTPVIMSNMSYTHTTMTLNPWIFVGAATFSLVTVLISCRRPGKIAGKVSPVEAVRYTENTGIKKTVRKGKRGGIFSMALANLSRNRKKTVLVVLSLSLAVVLLQITFILANGFDMDKYLRDWVVSDFIVGEAGYFQTGTSGFSVEEAVSEETIESIQQNAQITEDGRIYGKTINANEEITPDRYRQKMRRWMDEKAVEKSLEQQERTEQGNVYTEIQLYGMEKFPLDQLTVVDGDLESLYDSDTTSIAAVYLTDDYDAVEEESNWAKVGDQVTVRYIDELEYFDTRSGETITDFDSADSQFLDARITKSHMVTYTVAACVTMRHSMSYRYYGSDEFILNSEVFKRDTGGDSVMTYLFNSEKETEEDTEAFLKNYTENIDVTLDYESKQAYVDQFNGFRSMFLLLGSALSFIIALVGILNFLNAVLTSIMTRRREFAMLESIGMTRKQLKSMLICEGIMYAAYAGITSVVLSILGGPLMNNAMSSMFWFFTYNFTMLPVLIVIPIFLLLGVIIPLAAYHGTEKQTVVERLREAE